MRDTPLDTSRGYLVLGEPVKRQTEYIPAAAGTFPIALKKMRVAKHRVNGIEPNALPQHCVFSRGDVLDSFINADLGNNRETSVSPASPREMTSAPFRRNRVAHPHSFS